jgi:hypothetical protein
MTLSISPWNFCVCSSIIGSDSCMIIFDSDERSWIPVVGQKFLEGKIIVSREGEAFSAVFPTIKGHLSMTSV